MAQRADVDLNMPSTDCVALAVANQIGSGRLFTTRISRKSDPCARSVSLKRARGQIESVARELCAAQTQLMGAGWVGSGSVWWDERGEGVYSVFVLVFN